MKTNMENTSESNYISFDTNNTSCFDLTETLENFKNIMDLPPDERSTKLNTISPLTSSLDKKIGEYLFISKEMVWLIHEIKSFNLNLREERKQEKAKNKQKKTRQLDDNNTTTELINDNEMLIDISDTNTTSFPTVATNSISKNILVKQEIGQHDFASKTITTHLQNTIMDCTITETNNTDHQLSHKHVNNTSTQHATIDVEPVIHMETNRIPSIEESEIKTKHHPTRHILSHK